MQQSKTIIWQNGKYPKRSPEVANETISELHQIDPRSDFEEMTCQE
jgi:hypothetical protein